MSSAERRYREDNVFKTVVDTLHALIDRTELTPSEIREAAMLACIHYETYNVRPVYPVRRGTAVEYVPMHRSEKYEPER